MELDAQCTKQQDLSAHTAVVKRTGGLPQHLSIKIQSCPALNSVLLCTGHGMGLWNMKKIRLSAYIIFAAPLRSQGLGSISQNSVC